ncbi:GH15172 [Drosophila grimshawi]|uniref:GH15172 n=1 Tax=Drosophila grimshawi TaxID=7222 RepID=B4IXV9_DROGR|nr:GH15172 [Drosophila grimshawi]
MYLNTITTILFCLSFSDRDNIGGGLVLRFVPRAAWLAQPPQKVLPNLDLPVPMVIVLPTNSENCSFQAQCVFRVRFLQTYNIESQQLDDIAFNFLIGGDGNVYVGRGWETVGAHMIGYNTRSLSLGYIGYFRHQQPSPKQLNVTRLLLEEGVKLGKIATNYILVGAGSLEPGQTEYNAEQLYQSFSNWTHWTTVV